jgi:hypothetical protein
LRELRAGRCPGGAGGKAERQRERWEERRREREEEREGVAGRRRLEMSEGARVGLEDGPLVGWFRLGFLFVFFLIPKYIFKELKNS